MLTLRCLFEGQITKCCKLQGNLLPGSVDGAPHQPRPLIKTVRTPTAKDCLGKIDKYTKTDGQIQGHVNMGPPSEITSSYFVKLKLHPISCI